MDTGVEANIFRHHIRNLVPDGATGIPKLKRFPCGSTVEQQRCISNLVPMSASFRHLWSDSSLLPPTCFECIQPGRASWTLPKVPCSVYPDGDPNQWVYVAIFTVSLECVDAVVLINILPHAWCSTSQGSRGELFPSPPCPQLGLHGCGRFAERSGHPLAYSSLSSCMC